MEGAGERFEHRNNKFIVVPQPDKPHNHLSVLGQPWRKGAFQSNSAGTMQQTQVSATPFFATTLAPQFAENAALIIVTIDGYFLTVKHKTRREYGTSTKGGRVFCIHSQEEELILVRTQRQLLGGNAKKKLV